MPDQNARVNELPLGTPKIGDWFLFYDELNDITKRCSVDPFIASDSNDIEWVEGEDYDEDEIVTYGGNIYQSEVDNNTAVPGTPGSNWTLKTAGVSGLVFWVADSVYIQEEVLVLGFIDGVVSLFRLNPDLDRPYTSGADFFTDAGNGDWIKVGTLQTVSISFIPSGTVGIQMFGMAELTFKLQAPILSTVNWSFTQAENAIYIPSILFEITAGTSINFNDTVLMSDSRYLASTWTCEDSGSYIMECRHDIEEDIWYVDIHGPYTNQSS